MKSVSASKYEGEVMAYRDTVTIKSILLIATLAIPTTGMSAKQKDSVPQLIPKHKAVLQKWLAQKPNFRLAIEEDCGDCQDDLAQIRRGDGGKWKAVPNYQPYYSVGDFNSDGIEDFAVALIKTDKQEQRFAIAIFNGPFGIYKTPTFFQEG